jgi:hypothetical protein
VVTGINFFIVSKMVKTLQFIAATLVSMNFNRKGRYGLRKERQARLVMKKLCALCEIFAHFAFKNFKISFFV